MNRTQHKKLEKMERLLGEVTSLIRELKAEDAISDNPSKEIPEKFDASSFLASLKILERSAAEKELEKLKQHQLGALFGASGGSPNDKKKPKNWLIEQILWREFDFQRGQNAIREEFDKKS